MTNHDDQEVALELPSVFDPKTCARRGMCPVTQPETRRQREPLFLYFEVHDSGPESSSRGNRPPSSKRAFEAHLIRSLYNSSPAWLPQVEHFGKLERYTTLVFDNRGAGLSGAPWGVFSFVHGFVSE